MPRAGVPRTRTANHELARTSTSFSTRSVGAEVWRLSITSPFWSSSTRSSGDRADRFRQALLQGFEQAVPEAERQIQAERWRITEPDAFACFLDRLVAQRRALGGTTAPPALDRGKLYGLVLAVLAVLAFPEVMRLLGFPITAFLFLAGLMMVLWPRLDLKAVVRIVPVSAAVAYALWYVFWKIFYVVFPEGELTGF